MRINPLSFGEIRTTEANSTLDRAIIDARNEKFNELERSMARVGVKVLLSPIEDDSFECAIFSTKKDDAPGVGVGGTFAMTAEGVRKAIQSAANKTFKECSLALKGIEARSRNVADKAGDIVGQHLYPSY